VTLTQEVLRHQVAQRIGVARPDLADRGLSPAALADVRREAIAQSETSTAVVCVLRRLDLAALVAGTCALAASLPAARVADWRRSFTRTIFLAGNPDNLRDRFAFHYADPGGAIAWTESAPLREHAPLRRLLRLFEGAGALPPAATVRVPGSGVRPVEHDLYVASTGVTVGEYMVHLGHLLAEAVFDGLIGGGDRLAVRPVPCLIGLPGPFEAVRVADDPHDPDRLRAYAALVRSRS
jgi:hypothetical protein